MQRTWNGKNRCRKTTGFSLVELVVVLILLGIIGAVTLSRFGRASSFEALAARNGVISVVRDAQQLSLGRQDATFDIELSGSEWVLSASIDGGTEELRRLTVPADSIVLETGSTAASASTCTDGFDDPVAMDFSIAFDGKGNAESFTNNSITQSVENGVRICINDDDAMSVCISPGGFAHEGNCES